MELSKPFCRYHYQVGITTSREEKRAGEGEEGRRREGEEESLRKGGEEEMSKGGEETSLRKGEEERRTEEGRRGGG